MKLARLSSDRRGGDVGSNLLTKRFIDDDIFLDFLIQRGTTRTLLPAFAMKFFLLGLEFDPLFGGQIT